MRKSFLQSIPKKYQEDKQVSIFEFEKLDTAELKEILFLRNQFSTRAGKHSVIENSAVPLTYFSNFKNSIQNYKFPFNNLKYTNCFAVILSTSIIHNFQKYGNPRKKIKKQNEDFYHICIKKIGKDDNCHKKGDLNTLLIHLQQMMVILDECKRTDDQDIFLKEYISSRSKYQLFVKLFSTFWNIVKWDKIFLSMPAVARQLQENRSFLVSLAIKQKGRFRLDTIANKFITSTKLGNKNDPYIISFLDFYFFTWLSHFGIIEYIDGKDSEPVALKMTDFGRKFLGYFYSIKS